MVDDHASAYQAHHLWGRGSGNTPFCAVCPLDRTAGRSIVNFCARDRSSRPVAVSGQIFGWSDTWQLVINTGTTIVTFLMNGTTMHPGRCPEPIFVPVGFID
jgi:hypothetical protein